MGEGVTRHNETETPKRRRQRLMLDFLGAAGVLTILVAGSAVAKQPGGSDRGGAEKLPYGALTRMVVGHEVRGVAFSPDGKTLATAAVDNDLRLWDAATGKEVRRFRAHKRGVIFVFFSRDGKTLFSGGFHNIRMWSVATGKEIRTWNQREPNVKPELSSVMCAALSPDGKVLVSGSYKNSVRLWDVATGKLIRELQKPTIEFDSRDDRVDNVAFSPDGRLVGAVFLWRQLRIWDVATGKERWHFSKPQEFQDIRAKPAGKAFAPDTQAFQIMRWLWPTATAKLQRPAAAQGQFGLSGCAISPDGKTVVGGWGEGMVGYWDVATGRIRGEFQGHARPVLAVAFSPDGKRLASGSMDGTVLVWDATWLEPKPRR